LKCHFAVLVIVATTNCDLPGKARQGFMQRVAVQRPAAVGRALGKRQLGVKSLNSQYESTVFCIKKVGPEIFDLFC